MFFFALPFYLIAAGFMLLASLRMCRVVAIRMRGQSHPSRDFEFVALNVIVALAFQGVANVMMAAS